MFADPGYDCDGNCLSEIDCAGVCGGTDFNCSISVECGTAVSGSYAYTVNDDYTWTVT